MDIAKVIEFANANGYQGAKYLNKWHGYDVYEPIMDLLKPTYLGPPIIILVKGDSIRMSTPDEGYKRIDELNLLDDIKKWLPKMAFKRTKTRRV